MTTSERPTSDAQAWPKPNDLMRFLGRNGYDLELRVALDTFQVGGIYTVKDCRVGGFDHRIQFKEVAGWYNGVMFEMAAPSPLASAPASPAIGIQAVTDEMVDAGRNEILCSNVFISREHMRAALEAALHPAPEAASPEAAEPAHHIGNGVYLVDGTLIGEFVRGYQFDCSDGGYYTPTASEQAMIEDAICGFLCFLEEKKPSPKGVSDGVRAALEPLINTVNALDGMHGFDDDKRVNTEHFGPPHDFNDWPALTWGDLRAIRDAALSQEHAPGRKESQL